MHPEHNESIWSSRLSDFLAATASAEPTPGGGSVAGVSATLGLGLVIMALEISLKRKDAVHPMEMEALIENGRRQLADLRGDADEDILAFRAYMAALKLPKQTAEEKATRAATIQAATGQATESPLRAARHMVEALHLAENAAPLVHRHVISDVGAGAGLLEGALKAVLLNVDINLPQLAGAGLRATSGAERVRLGRTGSEIAANVLRMTSRLMAEGTEIIQGAAVLQGVMESCYARRDDFAGKRVAVVAFGKSPTGDAAQYQAARISTQEKIRALTGAGFSVAASWLSPELPLSEFEDFLARLASEERILAISVQMPIRPDLAAALGRLKEKDLDAVAEAGLQDPAICAAAEAALRLIKPWGKEGVAVIGAKGFVGKAVCRGLRGMGFPVVALDLGDDLHAVRHVKTVIAAANSPEILDARHLTSSHEMVVDIGFCPIGKELKEYVGNVNRSAYAVPARLTETPGGMGPLALAVMLERLFQRATGESIAAWSYHENTLLHRSGTP
jgi:formiminotetrahydrofolate cyclodeaminase/5,10-methylene-tetrahydrofolate dehydrogenase/methenyl tetrahydrofolate cyclohydrolase